MTDWKLVKLGEVAAIQTGPFGSQLHESDYVKDGTPIITVENLIGGKIQFTSTTPLVAPADVQRLSRYTLEEGDVVFSRVGAVDRSAYCTADADGWMFSGRILRVRPKSPLDPKYLNYYLSLETIKNRIRNHAVGGTMASLNTGILNQVPIVVPPEDEQKRIVTVLETWDKYLEKLDDKILAKNNIKQGLLQNLLVDGANRDWNTLDLDEVCEIRKGTGLSKEKLTPSGQRECILYGELYTKYSEVIDSVISRTEEASGVFSKTGDVLIPASTTTSHLDLAIASSVKKDNILLGGDINILRPKHEGVYDSDFLAYYLTHAKKHELARLAQGITIVHLYAKDFRKMKLTIPPLEEQKKIVKILKTSTEEISVLMKKREHVSEQKRFLTNNLVGGKIRTPENLTMPAKEVQYA